MTKHVSQLDVISNNRTSLVTGWGRTTNEHMPQFELWFLAQWIGANILGWVAGMIGGAFGGLFATALVVETVLGSVHSLDLSAILLDMAGGLVGAGAMTGVGLALAQWLILRRKMSISATWVGISACGWLLGSALSMALLIGCIWIIQPQTEALKSGREFADGVLINIIGNSALILPWVTLGSVQALLLQRHVQRAASWILASLAGPAVAILLTTVFHMVELSGLAALSYLVLPLCFPVITGLTLCWLSPKPLTRAIA